MSKKYLLPGGVFYIVRGGVKLKNIRILQELCQSAHGSASGVDVRVWHPHNLFLFSDVDTVH